MEELSWSGNVSVKRVFHCLHRPGWKIPYFLCVLFVFYKCDGMTELQIAMRWTAGCTRDIDLQGRHQKRNHGGVTLWAEPRVPDSHVDVTLKWTTYLYCCRYTFRNTFMKMTNVRVWSWPPNSVSICVCAGEKTFSTGGHPSQLASYQRTPSYVSWATLMCHR